MADWTDELKAEVVATYTKQEPTAETSVGIVEAIAEDLGKSVNGVRMILSKAGVYVCKAPAAGKASADKALRATKQDSIDALILVLEANGIEVDDSILSKMTGKAAIYFKGVLTELVGE